MIKTNPPENRPPDKPSMERKERGKKRITGPREIFFKTYFLASTNFGSQHFKAAGPEAGI